MSSGAFAKMNSELVIALSDCSKISKDNQRLVCFDQLAKNNVAHSSSVKVVKEPVLQIEEIEAKEAKKIDDFSKQHLKKAPKNEGPDNITATISKLKKLIRGQWVIYFDNGQKWQQKGANEIKLKVGDVVRLKKGSLGAVFLSKEGSHRRIKVKRLK
jgi:hypothetical protein